MVSCLFGCIFLNISIIYSGFIGERLIELNNKIVLEVFGNSLKQVKKQRRLCTIAMVGWLIIILTYGERQDRWTALFTGHGRMEECSNNSL